MSSSDSLNVSVCELGPKASTELIISIPLSISKMKYYFSNVVLEYLDTLMSIP